MPLEIRELIIRTSVAADNAASAVSNTNVQASKEQLVREVTDEVMKAVKNQQFER